MFARILIVVSLIGLAACATDLPTRPPNVTPPVTVPAAWNSGDGRDVMPWSSDIQDSKLRALIEIALAQNFDLKKVVAQVDAARARSRIAGADRLPQLDLALTGARTKRSGAGVTDLPDITASSVNLGVELAWELDVWGRLRASTRAALADYRAAEKDLAAARLSLSANIARAWFNAVEADQQTILAGRTLNSFQNSMRIIEQRFQLGLGTALDVRLARGNVATGRANLYVKLRSRDAAIRTLKVLLGDYPNTDVELAGKLPQFTGGVPAGLPSELLLRRPDLDAERWRLLASSELVVSSEKRLLPRITLTADGGTASNSLQNLLDWDRLLWSLVGGITQPLFQGGRIRADVDLARANEQAALAVYAQTLLNAFNEVETSLAAEHFLALQERALAVSVEQEKHALALAEQQYENGLVGIITLLETQRRAFNAESAWLLTLNQKLQNRINLHLALGGDFDNG